MDDGVRKEPVQASVSPAVPSAIACLDQPLWPLPARQSAVKCLVEQVADDRSPPEDALAMSEVAASSATTRRSAKRWMQMSRSLWRLQRQGTQSARGDAGA